MLKLIILGALLLLAVAWMLRGISHRNTENTGRLLFYPIEKASEADRIKSEAKYRIEQGEDEMSVQLDRIKKLDDLNN
jgi:hypothetical protein